MTHDTLKYNYEHKSNDIEGFLKKKKHKAPKIKSPKISVPGVKVPNVPNVPKAPKIPGVPKIPDFGKIAKDIANAGNVVSKAGNDIAKVGKDIPKTVNKIGDDIKGEFTDIGKDIKNEFTDIGKDIKSEFKDIGDDIKDGVDKGLDGMMDSLKNIINGLEPVIKFFKKVLPYFEKFFSGFIDVAKNWDKALQFMTNPKKAMAAVLTLTIPFIGQIMARAMLYNGSIDQPWLFLFAVPPMTIIPVLAMMFGQIDNLDGGAPWDNVVWLPMIGIVLGALVSKNNKIMNIIKLGLGVGSFFLAYSYKSKKACGDKDTTSKVALDSLNSYMITIVLAIILPYLPFIGKFFSMIQALLPMSDIFFQAFAVFMVYVGTNVVNGSFSSLCKVSVRENDLYYILLFAIVLTMVLSVSPGNTMEMIMNMQ